MSQPNLKEKGYDEKEVRDFIKKMENFNFLQKFPGANPVSFSDDHMFRL